MGKAGPIVVADPAKAVKPHLSARDIYAPSTRIAPPTNRPLRVYAYDPSHGNKLGNSMTMMVPYEPLAPGPVGKRFAVIDYDGARKTYYLPVDLDDPLVMLRQGLEPSEVDPRFHQQMVYAVAVETLRRFQAALGRKVHWRFPTDEGGNPIYNKPNILYLHPHAMNEANAFYTPDAHAIVFGYFRAGTGDVGRNLPGQTVFTCLSHDVIAHEVTHAIVDGIRAHFMEPTNIDVPAFHEAFADLAALFRHFSHREVLLDTLRRTGGRLFTKELDVDARAGKPTPSDPAQIQAQSPEQNPMIALATQFGQATGMHSALRSALGTPATPDAIKTLVEPHERGSILVAAVFDAYFTIYLARTRPLFQLYRPSANGDDVPQPLAELLAAEASHSAEQFFGICARALDYCPPVDITFGDFLRALITADIDLHPDDPDGVRDALMQSFRLRGIVPEDALYFSEGSLCWPRLAEDAMPPIEGLVFGDPNGLTPEEKARDAKVLHDWATANAKQLGFDPERPITVPSFHPMFRIQQSGKLATDMVVELIQATSAPLYPGMEGSSEAFALRGGVTLIVERPSILEDVRQPPRVRYAIGKHISPRREARQRAALTAGAGVTKTGRIDFAQIHGGSRTWLDQ